MTLAEILVLLSTHKLICAGVVIVILSCIEISPLKLNPWNLLIRLVRKFNGVDMLEKKMDCLAENVTKLEDRVGEGQAISARVRILRFGDEIRINTPHSKENYDQVLDDIKRYNQYCDTHPDFENDKTVLTAQIIEDQYKEHIKGNSFL